MSKENINVLQAFDPEARQAQADFDAYLAFRPGLSETVLNETQDPAGAGNVVSQTGAIAIVGTDIITASFEKPVVEVLHYTKIDRVGMMLDDVRDNREFNTPPYAAEYSGPEASLLRESLFPEDAVNAVRRIGAYYAEGSVHRSIYHTGEKGTGKFHPHYYFIDKTHTGKTRMFFVDPEHKVAKNVRFRPSIVNLVGIEVSDESGESPQVAILRYRVPEYDPTNKPDGMGPNELRAVIEEVLDSDCQLPASLTKDAERQVLFMIASSDERSRVQGRYSTKKQMESFAKGGKGSSALEGKIYVQAYVLNKLIELFNAPANTRRIV